MRTLIVATLMVSLSARAALAEAPASPPTVARQFLRVEPSTWDWFGVALKKDDQKVGPGFFAVVPDEAIKGSSSAKGHAAHARAYQGLALGLGIAGLGLVMGSAVTRQRDHGWDHTPVILGLSGFASLLGGSLFAIARDWQAAEAVNSYNYDVVTGNLQ